MYKIKKEFWYMIMISIFFGGCSNYKYNLDGYSEEVTKKQYIIATVKKDIICKDAYAQGFSNYDIEIKKNSILVGAELHNKKELKLRNFQGAFSSDIITLPEGTKITLQGQQNIYTLLNPSKGFYKRFYNNLLVNAEGKPFNVVKDDYNNKTSVKCIYEGDDSPIKITYQKHNKNNPFPKSKRVTERENSNFLAKLAGTALVAAVGSKIIGGEATAQSTELVGAALQDIWTDDKESNLKRVLDKQNNENIRAGTSNSDVFQDVIDDSNRMVDNINQNIRNEKLKKAELQREATITHSSSSTRHQKKLERANRRIAQAEKKLADAKAHDKAMRTSASNARKEEEARKLARASRGEIAYQGSHSSSRTNNSTQSSEKEQNKIAIAYCWGKTNDYSKKKRFKCSGRIQLSLYPEDAKDKYDEARAVSAQLGLVGCTGKIGVNRAYDLGHATLFPVRSQSQFPDFIGEGIDDGAWFKCYDHKLQGGDNSAGKVSRFIHKQRAKK